jgi:hypothetical protein
MQLSVMATTEGHREFIADFEADRPWLGKPEMMRVAGLPAANQASLRSNKSQMCLVTPPFGLGKRELAFVDLA